MNKLDKSKIFGSDDIKTNLAQKSIKGGIKTIGSQVLQFIIRTSGIVVLSRLLTPNDYGLVGMVTVVVSFLRMFQDSGLSMATVQQEHISHEQVSTLFWLNLFISVILCVMILICAPLVSIYYDKKELTAITSVLSISFLFSGLVIQHKALLRRQMQFGVLSVIPVLSQAINVIVTIILAYLGYRYWSLIWGSIIQVFTETVAIYWACPWVPGWIKRKTGVRSMLRFGGHLTGFEFVNYFSRNMDNILIGKYVGAVGLGLYSRAYQLFMMPITQIRSPLSQVAIPGLSALNNDPVRYVLYYRRLLDILATLTFPLTLYCTIEAEFIIQILLGPQWSGVVPVFRILSIAGLIETVFSTQGIVLITSGHSKKYLIVGAVTAIVTVTSIIIGISFGIIGVATGYTIVSYIMFPSLYYAFKGTPVKVSMFLKTIIKPLFISVITAVILLLLKYLFASDNVGVHILYMLAFLGIYCGFSFSRKSIREIIKLGLKTSPKAMISRGTIS